MKPRRFAIGVWILGALYLLGQGVESWNQSKVPDPDPQIGVEIAEIDLGWVESVSDWVEDLMKEHAAKGGGSPDLLLLKADAKETARMALRQATAARIARTRLSNAAVHLLDGRPDRARAALGDSVGGPVQDLEGRVERILRDLSKEEGAPAIENGAEDLGRFFGTRYLGPQLARLLNEKAGPGKTGGWLWAQWKESGNRRVPALVALRGALVVLFFFGLVLVPLSFWKFRPRRCPALLGHPGLAPSVTCLVIVTFVVPGVAGLAAGGFRTPVEIRPFRSEDIRSPGRLALKLKRPRDGVSLYLSKNLSDTARGMLEAWNGAAPLSESLRLSLAGELNRRLADPDLYAAERFSGVWMPGEVRQAAGFSAPLRGKDASAAEFRKRLNRLLLEAAYAGDLAGTALAEVAQGPNVGKLLAAQLLLSLFGTSVVVVWLSRRPGFSFESLGFGWRGGFLRWIFWVVGGTASAVFLVAAALGVLWVAVGGQMLQPQADFLVLFLHGSGPTRFLFGFLVSIIAPVAEELLFRGLLYGALVKSCGRHGLAALLSGVVFGLAHGDASAFFLLSVFGYVLAALYARSGSLLVPMAVHGLWNLGQFLMLYITLG